MCDTGVRSPHCEEHGGVLSRGPEVGALAWVGLVRADSSLRGPTRVHCQSRLLFPEQPPANEWPGGAGRQAQALTPVQGSSLQGPVGCDGAGCALRLHLSSASPSSLLPVPPVTQRRLPEA